VSIISDILTPVARAGLTTLSRQRLPQVNGEITLAGLRAPVRVLRDRWGIPHIYAQNDHDLFFAQGFVQAQDRLWQMELYRRVAAGRLSEIVGEQGLPTDRLTRTLGLYRLGEQDRAALPDDLRAALWSYAEGVNAYLEHFPHALPIEFTLLGHRPEPWTISDTMALSRMMVWQLSTAWYGEIVRAQITETVGPERAAELEAVYPHRNPVALPEGITVRHLEPAALLTESAGSYLFKGQGSNAWVIAGHKSTTGMPILCNDMHLPLMLPSIWYENHLVSDSLQVSGVSVPGMPLVMVGHNAHIAWGATLGMADAEDLFVENMNASLTRYAFRGEWLDVQTIPETIYIKGHKHPHIERVIITHHGPIISSVLDGTNQFLALSSVALQPLQVFQGWWLLNRACDWPSFVEAVRHIRAPQLALVYADVAGNIGYWLAGAVPIRARGQADIPSPGWTGEYEWAGEVPFEEMPHVYNPPQGYVVTCNNRAINDDYPYFLGNSWQNGYRAQRAVDVLESQEKFTLQELARLQLDTFSQPAIAFVGHVHSLPPDDPDVRLAQDLLHDWDGRMSEDTVAGCVYQATYYSLVRNLFEAGLGTELMLRFLGEGFNPLLRPISDTYGQETAVVLRLLDTPTSWWITQAGGREALLLRSVKQGLRWLRQTAGPDPQGWQWGNIHRMTLVHPFSTSSPLGQLFNLGPYPLCGDGETLCRTGVTPHGPDASHSIAASFRQVVDMGNLSHSVGVLPPGQSGQLGSPHYDDQMGLWLRGEYRPLLWNKEQVEAEAVARLSLLPAKGSG
jgi:penicillin amidase